MPKASDRSSRPGTVANRPAQSFSPNSIQSLDIENLKDLEHYLRAEEKVGTQEPFRARSLPGGVSSRVVLVERPGGEAWVLKQALPKLRVALDWWSSPERAQREALAMRYLGELAPPGGIAPLVFEDHANHLLAMAAVPTPHENWKTRLLAVGPEPRHVRAFGRLLGTIHRRAWGRRVEMGRVFADRTYFESLRLEPYYLFVASRDPRAAAFLEDLVDTTRVTARTLVHGDYSPKNILIHDDRLVLVDHEVVHFGDGAFDVGFAATHLLSKANHMPDRRAAFAQAAERFWRGYSKALGSVPWPDHERRAVRHALGCLLARVDGRSPLEYLTEAERRRQREAVLQLMADPPETVSDLVPRFVKLV
ncbi:MAG: phosphotransferase family protein [Candidatus Limnocylindria bacterium]